MDDDGRTSPSTPTPLPVLADPFHSQYMPFLMFVANDYFRTLIPPCACITSIYLSAPTA